MSWNAVAIPRSDVVRFFVFVIKQLPEMQKECLRTCTEHEKNPDPPHRQGPICYDILCHMSLEMGFIRSGYLIKMVPVYGHINLVFVTATTHDDL